MKRLWIIYTGLFLSGIIAIIITLVLTESPEKLILGEWDEVKWEYERVNKTMENKKKNDHLSHEIKNVVGQDLIIHQAESWRFLPDGVLELKKKDQIQRVHWSIKGRGHILQLHYNNHFIENYNIDRLKNNELTINFEADIEVRGIAKLTFKKKQHVTQIQQLTHLK